MKLKLGQSIHLVKYINNKEFFILFLIFNKEFEKCAIMSGFRRSGHICSYSYYILSSQLYMTVDIQMIAEFLKIFFPRTVNN